MRAYYFIVVLLLITSKLIAQKPDFIFHNIAERQGLTANYCFSILTDSRGLLWVGTADGLSRFDGKHFYNFKASNDSTSFINKYVLDLCEDKNGNIWGGTASGIFCYQPRKNVFINYIPPTVDFARSIKNIHCDKQGNIWATSEWNILKLNRQKNIFEEIGSQTPNKDSLIAYSVCQNGLVEDPSGKGLWFATRSGLLYYNKEEYKFYSYKNADGNPLFNYHSVSALSLSATGNLWLFDNVAKDIISFDPKTLRILQRINVGVTIPGAIGRTLFEDSNNRLWFSAWNDKMVAIDYKTNSILPFAYKNENPLSVAGDSFWDAFEDEDKNIWLASAGGISRCNYSKNAYSIIPISENVPQFRNSALGAFTIDPTDNSWWIASEKNISVIQYYPASGSYKYFDFSKAVKNKQGQLPGPVYGVKFIDGQPYACTHSGIWLLKKDTKEVVPFDKDYNGMPAGTVCNLIEDGNTVWLAAKDYLIKWNKLSNTAVRIKAKVDTLSDGQRLDYSKPFIDSKGKCWLIPSFGWIAYIDDNNEVVLKYFVKNKSKELSGYVTSITDDKLGNLWIAAFRIGLYKYNIENATMHLYDQTDGILGFSNQVIADRNGYLWMASLNKFSVFNPKSKSSSYYSLPINENTIDYSNMFVIDSIGSILSTSNKHIVKFNPERLNLKPVLHTPLISLVKISGNDKLVVDETELDLEPDENSLEFYFGSLIMNEIFPYSFEYMLDGFDNNWLTASTSATALYNNLQPGNYTFRVRAVAKDKTWQTSERIISLTIRTPFYKALWFWLMIAGLLVAALFYFYRFRLNKQKQILTLETKAQKLEKEKTLVMYENLKQQLNPHFLFNSLSSLSGLIETDQELAGNFLEQMSGIYRYILKNGDNETVSLKDEIEFVELYISLQQTRFQKALQVNFNIPDEYLHYKIAPVTLQNLIENAIKHNIIDVDTPLVINIFIKEAYIVVVNNIQKKKVVGTSNKKGLTQFISLYYYLHQLPVVILENEKYFEIKVPLI